MCQISIRTLQRHIRAEYGVTLRAWLAECRLHEGRARLAAGERAKVVAIELGFKHAANFTRAFKNRFGVPPRTFAKSAERAQLSAALGLDSGEGDKPQSQLEVLTE
jgi:AraC-like DNA-binding protein